MKFDRAIPREIRDRLQRSGIRLRRFSKYAAGLEASQRRPRNVLLTSATKSVEPTQPDGECETAIASEGNIASEVRETRTRERATQ